MSCIVPLLGFSPIGGPLHDLIRVPVLGSGVGVPYLTEFADNSSRLSGQPRPWNTPGLRGERGDRHGLRYVSRLYFFHSLCAREGIWLAVLSSRCGDVRELVGVGVLRDQPHQRVGMVSRVRFGDSRDPAGASPEGETRSGPSRLERRTGMEFSRDLLLRAPQSPPLGGLPESRKSRRGLSGFFRRRFSA